MNIASKIKETNFELCSRRLLEKATNTSCIVESSVTFEDENYGMFTETQIATFSFLVNFQRMNLLKPLQIQMKSDDEFMHLNFVINTPNNLMAHHIREVKADDCSYNVTTLGTDFEYLCIAISKNFFNSILNELKWESKTDFIGGTLPNFPDDFTANSMIITPAIFNVVREICNCDRKGFFKKMYIENKINELLFLQLEQYKQYQEIKIKLPESDIEKMHQARDYVLQNMNTPCSLIDLAKQIGSNEFKLKKNFKEVFGTTVFGYLNEVKMNKAREILLEGELNVTQVAEKVGFKTSNHFTTAFKKHFGYSPGSILKVALTVILNVLDGCFALFSEEVFVTVLV